MSIAPITFFSVTYKNYFTRIALLETFTKMNEIIGINKAIILKANKEAEAGTLLGCKFIKLKTIDAMVIITNSEHIAKLEISMFIALRLTPSFIRPSKLIQ